MRGNPERMFRLRKPCDNCPFTKGQGELFALGGDRLQEIFEAPAFQCHKTLAYNDEGETEKGDNPSQCAGLIALHFKERNSNAIIRAAMLLIDYNPVIIDASNVYDSYEQCVAAHTEGHHHENTGSQ